MLATELPIEPEVLRTNAIRMISYAQNREDVVLARAFSGLDRGFYIDVGAEHPVLNSVTKHFYDHGWRGINIEPSPASLAALEKERPDDVNLGVGVADFERSSTLFLGPLEHHGESTFRQDLADRYRREGCEFTEIDDVSVTTLARIREQHVGERTIDFLKIDVEGYEAAVIAGADWHTFRPRVVVVEATYPNSRTPSHAAWEPALLTAGYLFGLFDGLNRFYARAEEPGLVEALSSPACVFDDYVEFGVSRRIEQLKTQNAELELDLKRSRSIARRSLQN